MDQKTYENKLAYNANYNKATYKSYTFRLNKISDADLIDALDNLDTTAFIRQALKQYTLQHNLSKNLRSRKTKKLGMPYEIYSIGEHGEKRLIGTADTLDQAKDLRDAAYFRDSSIDNCIIVKRYMNKYGTVIAMKVKA